MGLEMSVVSIEMIELGKKNIKPCIGCFHCWKNDTSRCIQNDDVNDIYDKYNDADMIVYAFTIYWDTVPGILKNFIERAFCLEYPYMIQGLTKTRHPRRVKKDKAFFLFAICGFPEQSNFDSIKDYFKKVSHNAHMPLLGGIYRTACMLLPNDPGYFKTYNLVLESMQKAGESLIRTGTVEKKTLKTIHKKISSKEFQIHANKFWENVLSKDEYFIKSV
jgi:multimeric flavodoxin WrbA